MTGSQVVAEIRGARRPRRRSAGARARCLAPVLSLVLLAAGSGCGSDVDTRRLSGDAFTEVEVGSVTRPALALPARPGALFETTLDDVGRGDFRTHLALRDAAGGDARARVELLADDRLGRWRARGPLRCEIAWTQTAAPEWRRCAIAIDSPMARVRLRVVYEGPPEGELLLAAPVFEAARGRASRPPVFLVVLDTARRDGFTSFAEAASAGAQLARLARDGISFTRARSPTGWTRTAVASLLTGRSPFAHRVLDRFDALATPSVTLPGLLQQAGYVTLGWSTNPNVLGRWGFAQGFDAFTDVGTGAWAVLKPDGSLVLDAVEDAIERDGARGRFFYIHLMDAHQPYQPSDASLAELDRATGGHYTPPGRAPTLARTQAMAARYREYQGELYESDHHVGRLLDLLQRRGEYEDALIAVVSDHGEEFLDHMGSGHGKTLFEEMIRVPFWLKLPGGRRAGERIDADVGLVDLLPTLLSALDLPPAPPGEGRDLLGGSEPPASLPQVARLELEGRDLGAVVDGDWKLILDLADGREWLYDLSTDPTEQRDLHDANPDRAGALRAVFESRRFEHQRGWHLRACGAAETASLEFDLTLASADLPVRSRQFESDDALVADGNALHVRLDLAPRVSPTQPAFGVEAAPVRDEDEIWLGGAQPEGFEIRSLQGAPLRYVFGPDGALEQAEIVHSEGRLDAATAPPGRSVRCRDEARPYLHLWRVTPPSQQVRDLDPALSERLKALGYGQ